MTHNPSSLVQKFMLDEARAMADIDLPEAMLVHRSIIRKKAILNKIHLEWYAFFHSFLSSIPKGLVVDIGSGGSLIKEHIPHVLTSDVCPAPGIDRVFSATQIPLANQSVGAFFLLNVLHHIDCPQKFFDEAQRCLAPGGKIILIEPSGTCFARFIYRCFPHEPFNPKPSEWNIKTGGRLSGSNQAIPWMIFCRDREKFEKNYPLLTIKSVAVSMPFRYILSGGLTFKQFWPTSGYPLIRMLERILSPLNPILGMFMYIEIEKTAT